MVEKVEKFTVGKIKSLPKRLERQRKIEKSTSGKIKSLPKQLGKAEKGREIHIRKNQISTQTARKSRKG